MLFFVFAFVADLRSWTNKSVPGHSFFFLAKGHVVFANIVESFCSSVGKSYFGTLLVCLSVCFETITRVLFIFGVLVGLLDYFHVFCERWSPLGVVLPESVFTEFLANFPVGFVSQVLLHLLTFFLMHLYL